MERKLIIIAAVSENEVIGNKEKIPWDIPEDLARFRRYTLEHLVIMGRKPLEDRTNIVVTRNENFKPDGILTACSLEDAIKTAEEYDREIYIIGGGEIYKQSIDLATRLILTEVEGEYEGDAHFPEIDENKWTKGVINNYGEYSFVTYIKK